MLVTRFSFTSWQHASGRHPRQHKTSGKAKLDVLCPCMRSCSESVHVLQEECVILTWPCYFAELAFTLSSRNTRIACRTHEVVSNAALGGKWKSVLHQIHCLQLVPRVRSERQAACQIQLRLHGHQAVADKVHLSEECLFKMSLELASKKPTCLPKNLGPKGATQHARVASLEDGPNAVELARNREVRVAFELRRLEDVAHLGCQGFDVVAITHRDSISGVLCKSLGSGSRTRLALSKGLQEAMNNDEASPIIPCALKMLILQPPTSQPCVPRKKQT